MCTVVLSILVFIGSGIAAAHYFSGDHRGRGAMMALVIVLGVPTGLVALLTIGLASFQFSISCMGRTTREVCTKNGRKERTRRFEQRAATGLSTAPSPFINRVLTVGTTSMLRARDRFMMFDNAAGESFQTAHSDQFGS